MSCINGTVVSIGYRVAGGNACPDTSSPRAAQRRTCESCKFRELCLGSCAHNEGLFATSLVTYRRRVMEDEVLYRSGAKCESIYAISSGFFKTTMLSEDGIDQITGFQMPGDLLGLDGVGSGRNRSDAIALTQAEVCVIPCASLIRASHDSEMLQGRVLRALCDDLDGSHAVMLLLGNRSAEERVVAFIVDLSDRLLSRGRPWSEFALWMTRADIGSYLGLTLETVSRVLSRLDDQGFVSVRGRHIQIRDLDGLRRCSIGNDRRASRAKPRREESVMRAVAGSGARGSGHETSGTHLIAKAIIERARRGQRHDIVRPVKAGA